jgi:hypothetical protein
MGGRHDVLIDIADVENDDEIPHRLHDPIGDSGHRSDVIAGGPHDERQ